MENRGVGENSASSAGLEQLWEKTLEQARHELGETCVAQWIYPVKLTEINGDSAVLAAATGFLADWVERNYGRQLLRILQKQRPKIKRVRFTIEPGLGGNPDMAAPNGRDRAAKHEGKNGGNPADEAILQSAPLDPRFTFDSFVVGKPNELAHAAARRVAESADASFNPVFLYGGVGLGKTHLMHAIGWHLKQTRPNCRVLYLSAEYFMYRFVQALRYRDTLTFKQQFRSVDVLMVDDVQFIAGKESTQEEFFHTFNALIDQKKQIVISGDRSPERIDGLEERICSRLQWGLVVDIHPTDYELRLGILQSKAEAIAAANPNFEMDPKVLEFLAHRISSNVRVLEGALTRLFAFASLIGRRITMDMTQECLADLLRTADRKVTIEEIKRKVADHYNLRMSDLTSARRARAVARPRQVAMFLAKSLTSKSLPEIGRGFGGRDHTTVIHAVNKISQLRETDSQLADDIEMLRRMLEG
ncbi:MAG: chromosomal replication initiator protein DnaA [Paracoccaceae bacterium]|nr:chromosomal replication initiator protein DnaA [Paracoccaceae bacterium]